MLCERCGHENPAENYFCGHCGTALLHRNHLPVEPLTHSPAVETRSHDGQDLRPLFHVAEASSAVRTQSAPAESSASDWRSAEETRATPKPEPAGTANQAMGVSGPSFLGLAEGPGAERGLDYLYEGEPRSYGRIIVVLLLLAGFGAFLAYQWKQIPAWYTTIVKPQNAQPAQQAQVPAQVGAADSAATQSPDPQGNPPAPQNSASNDTAGTGGSPAADQSPDTAEKKETNSATASENKAPAKSGESAGAAEAAVNAPVEPSTSAKPARSDQPSARAEEDAGASDAAADRATAGRRAQQRAARTEPKPARQESDDLLSRGQAYLYGNGVPRSCGQALVYLRKAADLGNARARSQLGTLYATGHCVPLDRARAYGWFSLAADASQGHDVWIERNRQMLWNSMTEAERARARQAMY